MRQKRREATQSSLALLCDMMDPREERRLAWSPTDLKGILAHVLATPLALELGEFLPPSPAATARQSAEEFDADALTFGALLTDPMPPQDALRAAKDFAKQAIEDQTDALPVEVARVLYIAFLARARAAGYAGFSRLGAAEFVRAARRCLAQSWTPDAVRDVLREALAAGKAR